MAGALVIKKIKPVRLKEKEMRLELLNPMRKMADNILEDFQATTKEWKHKPKFERAISEALGGASVHVITTDEIYNYVNNGTKPHPIFAGAYTAFGGARALSFKWGGKGSYRPKTRPRVIGSTPGGPTGPQVAKPYVQHPGIKEPREFDKTIEKKWQPRFLRLMEKAMAEAAVASDHAIA